MWSERVQSEAIQVVLGGRSRQGHRGPTIATFRVSGPTARHDQRSITHLSSDHKIETEEPLRSLHEPSAHTDGLSSHG